MTHPKASMGRNSSSTVWVCHASGTYRSVERDDVAFAEGEQSAEAASRKAADKAEKLTQRLGEREQAEGRMGGEAGQRIVYDDAAIERLLDRSAQIHGLVV